MFPTSKRWKMLSAIGQGVLFSLALTGFVRLGCVLLGTRLPDSIGGTLFLVSSFLSGGLCAYLYARSLKGAEQEVQTKGVGDDRT